MTTLRVVLIKPSKYGTDGAVERFRIGFMPNATLYHIASLTPDRLDGVPVVVHTIDEYVYHSIDYLSLLQAETGFVTLLALVGVQSHQFHRALDLAAYARAHGVKHCVIGGPHPMTCDTSMVQGRGVSFSLAEAELVWSSILHDALAGELQPVYGTESRWASELPPTVIVPPSREALARYWAPMVGLYPVRGCPYRCSFCSVIKISGRMVRSQSVESTMESLILAKERGVETIMFVSDNFNKYPDLRALLEAMIEEELGLRFFCQCDTQVVKQEELINLMGRAGCFEMFVGVESFNRDTLKAVKKTHNHPSTYAELVRMCDETGIRAHFSNIIGFADEHESDVLWHLEMLKKLRPKVASFYVLTPIPGTDQYDDYRANGYLFERNLDRYDATCPTWRHPYIDPERMQDLLYQCYTGFYAALIRGGGLSDDDRLLAIFNRLMALQRMHPMSGGIDRLAVDGVGDYLELRKNRYGFELAPLPDSLALSPRDEETNRRASWRNREPAAMT